MRYRISWVMVLALLLLSPWGAYAASKQYVNPETPLVFGDTAQTEDAAITLSALANNAGRISARLDRGTGAHAAWYKWRCSFQATAVIVAGTTVEVYISTSDAANPDGEIGTADAALTTEKRRNLMQIGIVQADQTAANIPMTASGLVYIPDRYFSLGVWNALGQAFRTDTSVHHCTFTPMPPEQQ
jgi:hypothetical protein